MKILVNIKFRFVSCFLLFFEFPKNSKKRGVKNWIVTNYINILLINLVKKTDKEKR